MQPILLLTRPAEAAARFLAALDTPVRAEISPLIEIVPLSARWADGPVAALILTSENAAAIATDMGFAAGLTAYCVGDQTARAADAAGLRPFSASGDAGALIALILSHHPQGRLLHLRGEHARGDIAPQLQKAGVNCVERVVYRQLEMGLSDPAKVLLSGTVPVIAPLFSPRTATILAGQGPFEAPLHVIAISDAVTAATTSLGPVTVDVAERPDGAAMIRATLSRLRAMATDPSA